MIYFILNPESASVNIGYTNKDIDSRLSQLQIGCCNKLVIMATTFGEKKEEKLLHKKFNYLHLHGEWFKFDNDLRCFVSRLNTDSNFFYDFLLQELIVENQEFLKAVESLTNENKTLNKKCEKLNNELKQKTTISICNYGWIPSLPDLDLEYESPEVTQIVIQYNQIKLEYDAVIEKFNRLDKRIDQLAAEQET